jgi:hypothetical protein
VRTPILLYVVALAVRGILIGVFPDPGYTDAAYYVEVARSIASGHGLTVDFVWIFAEMGNRIPADAVLPVPSNGHWLPLASLVQVPFIWLLGPTALASALPMALIGSLAAPLTWAIAREVDSRPTVALTAGLLSAIPAAATVLIVQPDNFAIFLPLVAATLWLVAKGLKGNSGGFALAGLLAGLAAMGRNDGVLLAGTIGLVWLGDRWRWIRHRQQARAWTVRDLRPPVPVWAAAGAAVLFLMTIGPWWARQLAVFGSISPTASSGTALWLRSISEWNSITAQPSVETFLAQGAGAILESRLAGLWNTLVIFSAAACGFVLVPLLLLGAFVRRTSPDFVPWFVHVAVLSLGAAILYPLHIPGGAYLHSAIGLFPHAYVLVIIGVATLFDGSRGAIGRGAGATGTTPIGGIAAADGARERSAFRVVAWAAVVFATATAIIFGGPVVERWETARNPRIALAAELERVQIPETDRFLALDVASMAYWTGHPGVVTPNDPIETIQAVADAYGIRWLVLERGTSERTGPVPALAPILRGEARPAWVGPAAFKVAAEDGGEPLLALYPVCTATGDPRCAP